MSEISVEADRMTDFLVGASVAFGRSNDPRFQEKIVEAVTQLHNYIASLELQLAEAKAKLAGYEQIDSHGAAFGELAKGAE